MNHSTWLRKNAYFVTMTEKMSVIKEKNLCHACLTKDHLAKHCTSNEHF